MSTDSGLDLHGWCFQCRGLGWVIIYQGGLGCPAICAYCAGSKHAIPLDIPVLPEPEHDAS